MWVIITPLIENEPINLKKHSPRLNIDFPCWTRTSVEVKVNVVGKVFLAFHCVSLGQIYRRIYHIPTKKKERRISFLHPRFDMNDFTASLSDNIESRRKILTLLIFASEQIHLNFTKSSSTRYLGSGKTRNILCGLETIDIYKSF